MNHPTTRGQVTEVLLDLKFRIILADGKEILAYLGGKMKLHKIKVLEGDTVEVILDKFGGKPSTITRSKTAPSAKPCKSAATNWRKT